MKFKVNREDLKRALQQVSSVIGNSVVMPVISNVLIESEGEAKLKLTTTNLDVFIIGTVNAEVSAEGKCCLPAKLLLNLVGGFTGESIDFSVDDDEYVCNVVCNRSRYKLPAINTADFPEIFKFEPERTVKINALELKRSFEGVDFAAASEDSRKVLNGVLVNIRDGKVTFVTTDGRRLAACESGARVEGTDGDAVINIRIVNEIKKLMNGDFEAELKFGPKNCLVTTPSAILLCKLTEGIYPDFRQAIPREFKSSAVLPVNDLVVAVGNAEQVLGKEGKYITMTIGGGKVEIHAFSQEGGEGTEVIEGDFPGEPLAISLNPLFLQQPLRVAKSETVKMNYSDPVTPLELEYDGNFICVVMPIRAGK